MVAEQLEKGVAPNDVSIDVKLSALNKPFCEFMASALVALGALGDVILRGWEQPGYVHALFDENKRHALMQRCASAGEELWKGKNQKIRICNDPDHKDFENVEGQDKTTPANATDRDFIDVGAKNVPDTHEDMWDMDLDGICADMDED